LQAEKSTTASARAERLAARVKKLEGAQAAAAEASLKELEGSQIAAAEATTRAERLAARVKELEDAQATAAEVAARRRSAPWKENKNGKRENCAMCVRVYLDEKTLLIRRSQKYGYWLKTQPGEQGDFSARQLRGRFNRLTAEEHSVGFSYHICAPELKILCDSCSRHRRTRASQATFVIAAGSATGWKMCQARQRGRAAVSNRRRGAGRVDSVDSMSCVMWYLGSGQMYGGGQAYVGLAFVVTG
jgi:hypothetical protein